MIALLPPLSHFRGKKLLIITHSGADVDAIAAAGAVYFSLEKHPKIAVPGHISLGAKKFAEKMRIPYEISPSARGFDALLMLDFNSLDMAAEMNSEIDSFKGEKFLIDHHNFSKALPAGSKNSWIEPGAVATCQLIFEWIEKSKIKLSKEAATCIAAGIATDSAHFLIADADIFFIMAKALKASRRDFAGLRELFLETKDPSEKIATIKAAKRARIYRMGDYILVSARVGAFEADAAAALVKIGADVAFAGDSDNGVLRISGRASQKVQKNEKIDLAAHVFQKLSAFFEGTGGGHPGAAGFNGKGDSINDALQRCVLLTKEQLERKKQMLFKEYA